jgi:hypothetical protein
MLESINKENSQMVVWRPSDDEEDETEDLKTPYDFFVKGQIKEALSSLGFDNDAIREKALWVEYARAHNLPIRVAGVRFL